VWVRAGRLGSKVVHVAMFRCAMARYHVPEVSQDSSTGESVKQDQMRRIVWTSDPKARMQGERGVAVTPLSTRQSRATRALSRAPAGLLRCRSKSPEIVQRRDAWRLCQTWRCGIAAWRCYSYAFLLNCKDGIRIHRPRQRCPPKAFRITVGPCDLLLKHRVLAQGVAASLPRSQVMV
jgi:hypothetical protein